jgi:hypothetical protein
MAMREPRQWYTVRCSCGWSLDGPASYQGAVSWRKYHRAQCGVEPGSERRGTASKSRSSRWGRSPRSEPRARQGPGGE